MQDTTNIHLEGLLESAYKAGAAKDPENIKQDGWLCWRYSSRLIIEATLHKIRESTPNTINKVSIVPLNEWEDISTAPTNVWLVCRNANKRVFEAMKCSTLKSYCWVDRAKLQRDPKEWNRTLSLPEIENHE